MRATKPLAIALLFVAGGIAHASPPQYPDHPKDAGLVNDFANVLTPNQQATLEIELRKLEKDTKAEVAVVTVTSLHGVPIQEYSVELARRWGISAHGSKSDKVGNGVLFLIAPSLHKERIEVGTRLEPILTDGTSEQIILEHYHSHFLSGAHDVSGAIVDTTQEIDRTLRHGLTPAENKVILSHQKQPRHNGSLVLLGLAIVAAGFLFGLWTFFSRRKPSPARIAPRPTLNEDYSTGSHTAKVIGGGVGGPSSMGTGSSYTSHPGETDESFGTGLVTGAVLGAMSSRDEDESRDDEEESSTSPTSHKEEEEEEPSGGFDFGDSGDSGDSDNSEDFEGGGATGDD